MAVDVEFITLAKANLHYWMKECGAPPYGSAELEDNAMPALVEEVENILQAVEFALPLVLTDAAILINQLFPLFERHGHWQIGLQLTVQSFTLASNRLQAYLYNNAGALSRLSGHLDQAVAYHQHSVELFSLLANTEQLAISHSYLASCHYLAHKYKPAVDEARNAIQLLENTDQNTVAWGFAHDTLGLAQFATGNATLAIHQFEIAIACWKRTQRHVYHCRSLNNLARAYASCGQFARALQCFNAVLTLAQSQRNQLEIIRASINKGDLLCNLKAYNEAELLFRTALEALNHYPTALRFKAASQNNLGYILNLDKRFDEAFVWLRLAVENWQMIQDKMHYANSLGELGKCYWGLAQYDEAIDSLEVSIAILSEYKDNEWANTTISEMNQQLAELKKENRDESP